MIAIVDYKAGNLGSVQRAVEYLGYKAEVTDDPATIRNAERVILPGVGSAGAAMSNLNSLGLAEVLKQRVYQAGTPMLGICIGVQIIFQQSEEDGAACLGILPGRVRRFRPEDSKQSLKVPQIGWNQVWQLREHPIFGGIPDGSEFYFVNSYYPDPSDRSVVIAMTDYGTKFASVVAHGNLVATQFHLEKSGEVGLRMLANFCRWSV